MIGSSKNSTENYSRKCFWTQEKEIQVKFNPRLSANPSSNNWTQGGNWRRVLRIASTRACTTNCHARLRAKRSALSSLTVCMYVQCMYLCLLTLVRPFFCFLRPGGSSKAPPSITSKPLILQPPKLDKIMYSSFTTSEHNLIPLMTQSDVTVTSYIWIYWENLQNFPQSRHEAKNIKIAWSL